jgi:UDP-glucuronate 4-epimerase
MKNKANVIVTGGAGFIGSHLVEKLLDNNCTVTVIDNFDDFYDREIKLKNISNYISNPAARFLELDILDEKGLDANLNESYDAIFHLAAKAGVRPSIENPVSYQNVNVAGTQNLLEFARRKNIKQFIFASSSSVYGINKNVPWKENDGQLYPISPYASTKISGELMGHVYSKLYNIRFIGLRFFTVFGPRQRPDLAIHLFSKKILNNEVINVFGDGSTKRDYTYVADIVEAVYNALNYDQTQYEIINLGNRQTVSLAEMIKTIEDVFQKKAIVNQLPEQIGDVPQTWADINKAQELLKYSPKTPFKEGVIKFKEWLVSNDKL